MHEPTQTDRTLQLANNFITAMDARDFDKVASLFSADGDWFLVADPENFPGGGSMSGPARATAAKKSCERFWEFHFTKQSIFAKDEEAMFEIDVLGKGPGELEYQNFYAISIELDDTGKKIKRMRHYFDLYKLETWHAACAAANK